MMQLLSWPSLCSSRHHVFSFLRSVLGTGNSKDHATSPFQLFTPIILIRQPESQESFCGQDYRSGSCRDGGEFRHQMSRSSHDGLWYIHHRRFWSSRASICLLDFRTECLFLKRNPLRSLFFSRIRWSFDHHLRHDWAYRHDRPSGYVSWIWQSWLWTRWPLEKSSSLCMAMRISYWARMVFDSWWLFLCSLAAARFLSKEIGIGLLRSRAGCRRRLLGIASQTALNPPITDS